MWASQFGRQPPPPPPQDSVPEKKQKVDAGASALDFIKQEYAEAYNADPHQVVQQAQPGVSYAPAGMYGVAGMPGVAAMQGVPGMPGVAAMQGVPGMPGVAAMQGVPGMPGVAAMQGVPGMPGMPGVPGMPGMPGVAGIPGLAVVPGAYERMIGESQRAAVAQQMYGAALYQPGLSPAVKSLYGYPGLAESSQIGLLQQQQQLQLQQLQQHKAAGMGIAWPAASPSKQAIIASQGYITTADQLAEEYAIRDAKVAAQARAGRPDGDASGLSKVDYASYGVKSKDVEDRQTSGYYGGKYNDAGSSATPGSVGSQAWKQEKRDPVKVESDSYQQWGAGSRPGGVANDVRGWSGAAGYGAVKQEADDASRRNNDKPRKSRWEPPSSNDSTPPSDRPGILGSYAGGQPGSQDRQTDGRSSWGRGSSDQSSNRSGGFSGQRVSSEWHAQPRDTDTRAERRGGSSDRGSSSRDNFSDNKSQSDRGPSDSRSSFQDRSKDSGSFQDRSRQFGASRREDSDTFQDRDRSSRGSGPGRNDSRGIGSDGASRQYPPNRDASRDGDQGSRYRDNQMPSAPHGGDRFGSRGDRPASSSPYSQERGDRPGSSGGNKVEFMGRGAPPALVRGAAPPPPGNKMDFVGRGAPPPMIRGAPPPLGRGAPPSLGRGAPPSLGRGAPPSLGRGAPSQPAANDKMDFRGRGGPPGGNRMDFQAPRPGMPPAGNGLPGRGSQLGAPPGGRGQELSNMVKPNVPSNQNASGLPGNRATAPESKPGSGDGAVEDKKPEITTDDKSLLGSKLSHDAPPMKPHPMDGGPPSGFGRGGFGGPRGGRGGMRPPFGMAPGPPPERPMFRGGPPPGRGGPRFGGPRPGFGGPRGPPGGVHPLMGGPRGGFRPPGPGGPGMRGRGGFGGPPPRWQRPPRPPHM